MICTRGHQRPECDCVGGFVPRTCFWCGSRAGTHTVTDPYDGGQVSSCDQCAKPPVADGNAPERRVVNNAGRDPGKQLPDSAKFATVYPQNGVMTGPDGTPWG